MSVLSKAVGGLIEGLRRQVGDGAFMDGRADYVVERRDNLVPGVEPGMFEADLRQGKGGELEEKGNRPPKFHAAHSSAALAVNAFAPWTKEPDSLVLAGIRGFEEIRFEQPCDHGLDGRAPPTLDVLATGSRSVVAIESKCTEMLRPKTAGFSPRYDALADRLCEPRWRDVYSALQDNVALYRHLDAAQLVKHYLGLRNTFPGRNVILLYLFW